LGGWFGFYWLDGLGLLICVFVCGLVVVLFLLLFGGDVYDVV